MPLVIHVCGPSGSGKTTLGDKLKAKFPNITVKDTDNLRQDFIKSFYGEKSYSVFDKEAYQKYIDAYVDRQKRPLVFVGLNVMPRDPDHYYDLHADHKFYIELDDATIHKQKCLRWCESWANIKKNKQDLANMLYNNERFMKHIIAVANAECNLAETKKMNAIWNAGYARAGYTFLPREKVFTEVSKLIRARV